MRIIDYRSAFRVLRARLEDAREADMGRRMCTARVSAALQPASSKRCMGDVHADAVLETLDNLGVTRTPGQKQFHREFFCACLPHIYGSDIFERERERILHRYGFDRVRYEVLVVCPRRWGKTYGVSMFVAALLWCVPDMWISIFSTGQRASTSLLDLVYKFIAGISSDTSRVAAKNHEKLVLKGDNAADLRRCFSYPSSVQVTPRARTAAGTPAPHVLPTPLRSH